MTITVDIGSELESRLLHEAAKHGMDPGQFVINAVRARLENQNAVASSLDAEQSRLLGEINNGLSQTQWERYYTLVSKRQAAALTDDEFAELTAVSNRIEELNAHRMDRLASLARLRGTTLPELLDQLGIAPPPVI
jgi:hypothetical protein